MPTLSNANDDSVSLPSVVNTVPSVKNKDISLANKGLSDRSSNISPFINLFDENGNFIGQNDLACEKIYRSVKDVSWDYGRFHNYTGNADYGKSIIIGVKETSVNGQSFTAISIFTTKEFSELAVYTRTRNSVINELKSSGAKSIRPLVFFSTESLIQTFSEEFTSAKFIGRDITRSEQAKEFKELIHEIMTSKKPSDIHFEVSCIPHDSKIRVREDGILEDYRSFTYEHLKAITSAAYNVIGGDDKSGSVIDGNSLDGKIPQSARFVFEQDGHQYHLRVEVVPATPVQGWDLVCRVLNYSEDAFIRPINEIGFNPVQLSLFETALLKPQGLILVCGATGSGKSETTASAIQFIRSKFGDSKKIMSVENPVESFQKGVTQVSVEDKTNSGDSDQGITGKLLSIGRSFLRSDPDVLNVGEARDKATANLSISLSKTGHTVFTTMHTTEVSEVPARLESLGLQRSTFATGNTISLLIAQTLVRTVCPHCSLTMSELDVSDTRINTVIDWLTKLKLMNFAHIIKFPKSGGCKACDFSKSGRKGRIGVGEVMYPNTVIIDHWLKGNDVEAKKYWLLSGGVTKLEHAIEKMCLGILDPFIISEMIDIPTRSSDIRTELKIPLYKPQMRNLYES